MEAFLSTSLSSFSFSSLFSLPSSSSEGSSKGKLIKAGLKKYKGQPSRKAALYMRKNRQILRLEVIPQALCLLVMVNPFNGPLLTPGTFI